MFGLGHDPRDHRGHHEPDWAAGGARGFHERHGHGGFDPRAYERGFRGGDGGRHFDDYGTGEDPFPGARRHHEHGHGHDYPGEGYPGHHGHGHHGHGHGHGHGHAHHRDRDL